MNNTPQIFDHGTVHQIDAFELLASLPDASIDLIVTDPPYESLEKWRKLGTTTRLKRSKGSSNEWFPTIPNSTFPKLFAEFYRVLKPGTHAYIFCDAETRDILMTGYAPQTDTRHFDNSPVIQAGFKFWKSLVWNKERKGMGYHYPAMHELVIMLEKVEKKNKHRQLNFNNSGDIISAKALRGRDYYPTEKPYGLLKVLISESSNEGDTVLDVFAGSGKVGMVCRDIDRKFILGDINTESIIKNLQASSRQLSLHSFSDTDG